MSRYYRQPRRKNPVETFVYTDNGNSRFVVARDHGGDISLYTESRCSCLDSALAELIRQDPTMAHYRRLDEAGVCEECGGDLERQWYASPDEGTGVDREHLRAVIYALEQFEKSYTEETT